MKKKKTPKDSSLSLAIPIQQNKLVTALPPVASGSIEAYINYINSIPLLTEQEEYDLALKWIQHEDVEAARYLVLTHLRLVVSIARSFSGYGFPLADIIQEGTIGLMKAVKKFDINKKVRLVTFATFWIKAEINNYILKNWKLVNSITTRDKRKLFFNLRSIKSDLGSISNDEISEIASKLNVSRADIIEMNQNLISQDLSLYPEDNESYAPIEYLHDDSYLPENVLNNRVKARLHDVGIKKSLELLDERSRDIIVSRWLNEDGKNLTLKDLSHKYKISMERVRQIESDAMKKMEKFLRSFK